MLDLVTEIGEALGKINPGREERVPFLIRQVLVWLASTDLHLLIAGLVLHYELEFIHPFMDGNGRLGRLWQTLVLGRWRPLFFMIPIETVVHGRQDEYYRALRASDAEGSATRFVEFMLVAILAACEEFLLTPEVAPEVEKLLKIMAGTLGRRSL